MLKKNRKTSVATAILISLLILSAIITIANFPIMVKAEESTIDSYATTNQNDQFTMYKQHPSDTTVDCCKGQSFQNLDGTYKLTTVQFYLKLVGSITGTLNVVLYEHSGTYGTSSVPTGSALATSEDVSIAGIGGSFALVNFTFTGANQYEMQPLEYYVIMLEDTSTSGGDSSNYVHFGVDTSTPTHDGNLVGHDNGGYAAASAYDAIFYVYGELVEDGEGEGFGGNYSGWYNVTWDGVNSWSLQQACDDAALNVGAADGSIVFLPAGNVTFDINFTASRVNNARAGVQVKPLTKPMALFGAGIGDVGASNETILFTPLTSWNYDLAQSQTQMILDGTNDYSIRIVGICFQGSVNTTSGADDNRYLSGLRAYGVKDYRVDHCTFLDFCNTAIGVDNNYVHNSDGNRGVIDHNIFDNPYKDAFYNQTGHFPYWAYGVIVSGDNYFEQQWRTLAQVLGQYSRDVAYIEDNSFRRCRHEISSSSSGGWYVARFNNFTEMILSFYASYSDVHGGGRGCEFYNNTITNCLTTYASVGNQPSYFTQYMGKGIGLRGGAGIVCNNTFINFGVGAAVDLSNDQSSNSTWRLDQVWIWDNTYTNVTSQLSISPGAWTIDEDDEYFLRAPTLEDDDFNYNPYPYPHPLVTEVVYTLYTLTMQATTGGSIYPTAGDHSLYEDTNQTLIATASSGYSFVDWEIDGANQTATSTWYIEINGNRVAKAYFAPDTYTISVTVNNPQAVQYNSTNIPVVLSLSGNGTGKSVSWNIKLINGSWLYVTNQSSLSETSIIPDEFGTYLFAVTALDNQGSYDYKEVSFTLFYVPPGDTYILSLVISDPDSKTYSSNSVPVSLRTSGNDTNPSYSWNVQFSDYSWLYDTNQTDSSATMTIDFNTAATFCCKVVGDNGGNDYGEVAFSVEFSVPNPPEGTGGDTNVDTTIFFAGGACIFVLVVVFALILKVKSK